MKTLTQHEYTAEFLRIGATWPGLREFASGGGVPGCRVPETDLESLARWFYEASAAEDSGHDPRFVTGMDSNGMGRTTRIVRLSPSAAIEEMSNADASYNPDY